MRALLPFKNGTEAFGFTVQNVTTFRSFRTKKKVFLAAICTVNRFVFEEKRKRNWNDTHLRFGISKKKGPIERVTICKTTKKTSNDHFVKWKKYLKFKTKYFQIVSS